MKFSELVKEILQESSPFRGFDVKERISNLSKRSPAKALHFAMNQGKRIKEVEAILINNPLLAADYASFVIRGPWPEAEDSILKNAYAIYRYTMIAKEKRWPEAEEKLLDAPDVAVKYASKFNLGRWPELEQRILDWGLPDVAVDYADRIIGDRWPEAEELIMSDRDSKEKYINEFIGN